tara:strand:+ start:16638 stop:18446 length:1809 start_codon:yes stop_codon:yes gene_type:complete
MKFSLENLVVLDCEVYPNYFLAAFKNIDNNRVITIEKRGSGPLEDFEHKKLKSIMIQRTTFGFNSRNYDIPIILAALTKRSTKDIFKLSNFIIESNSPGWKTMDKYSLQKPSTFKHFDIQEPAPGVKVSLKLYGGRMHSKKLQDLPIEPGTVLTNTQMDNILLYCINDLDTTIDLYRRLEPEMKLRADMSVQYNQDLMSKADAQIAEAVIKSELQNTGGRKVSRAPKIASTTTFRYDVPKYINFTTPQLCEALKLIQESRFELDAKGSIQLPDELKKMKIKLGTSTYQLGVGGLHSKEKKQAIIPTENEILADRDVASYYPNIILNLELYPRHLGKRFLDVYKNLVKTRLEAKANKNKVVADSLKVVVNGSFGKLGSQYSVLYSPDLMMAVTLTGQLSLLMLIERLEVAGIRVVSANTDGFVSLIKKDMYKLYDAICFDWELDTNFELEETQYKALYSRDINNYFAITSYGGKGKGIFTIDPLRKNPQAQICIEAVQNYLINKLPIKQTILECTDITKFLSVRTVNGGAVWRNQYLGRVVRWVFSTDGNQISYKKNGNKVASSDGSRPIMELSSMVSDIDYQRYINTTIEILNDIGVNYEPT